MKSLSILFVTVLFIGFNISYAQSKTENDKNETEKMEMNHEKMDHSQMNHSKMDHEMKMNDSEEKIVVKPWNELCPVRGGEVDPEVGTVEYNNKAYGFCCGGCDKKFSKGPETYSMNLSEDGTKFTGNK
jgi:YHS domain-containing protein